jgi:hypothetical protein
MPSKVDYEGHRVTGGRLDDGTSSPMRLVPFSYFCTYWKVRPSASPSFPWLIASIMRRMRTRPPTCLSMGLGAFFPLSQTQKSAHFYRPAQRNIFSKSPGRQLGTAPGLGPASKLWFGGTPPKLKADWKPNRVVQFARSLVVPLVAHC